MSISRGWETAQWWNVRLFAHTRPGSHPQHQLPEMLLLLGKRTLGGGRPGDAPPQSRVSALERFQGFPKPVWLLKFRHWQNS